MVKRDFDDPRWKAIRFACFTRDRWTCCKCGLKGKKLNAHHIVPVSKNKSLEYSLNNVISLCLDCHDLVTGKESLYEEEFKRIIASKSISSTKKKRFLGFGRRWKPRNPRNLYGD